MPNTQSVAAGPRAHSIIALGLTKETRRFLLKLGIRTIDALIKLEKDYLTCNGANDSIVNEVESCLKQLNLQTGERATKDSKLLIGDDITSEPIADTERSLFSCRSIDEDRCDADRQIEEIQSAPLVLKHATLDALKEQCNKEAGHSDTSDEIISAMMLPDNRCLVLHSSDKRLLAHLARGLCLLYEDVLEQEAEVEHHYSMPIANLSLSVRAKNILQRQEIKSIGDLCAMGEERVLEQKGAGIGVADNIKSVLGNIDQRLVSHFVNADGKITPVSESYEFESAVCPMLANAPFLYEMPLDFSVLSVRAQHTLKNAHLLSVGSVLELGEEGLLRLRNTGSKTVNEILSYTQKQAEMYLATHVSPLHEPVAPTRNESVSIKDSELTADEKASTSSTKLRTFMIDIAEIALVSPIVATNMIDKGISPEEAAGIIIESMLKNILEKNPWGLTNDECYSSASLFDESISIDRVDAALRSLSSNGIIKRSNDVWVLQELTLEGAVKKCVKKEWQGMVLQRLKGKTLENIGEAYGITRERVRQVTSTALTPDILNGTRAGRYLHYMRRYELNEREVRFGLGANAEEWKAALFIKKTQYKSDPESLPAEKLLENRAIPDRVRLALEKEIHYGYVEIDGEYVPERRLDLMLYALKRYGSKSSLGDEELIELYEAMLQRIGVSGNPELQLSERYMSNFRLQKCVLSGYWSRVRYYDFDKFDVRDLIDRLGFEDFQGKEVSTRLFLSTKPELLKEFEIDDAYELHSLLRSYSREAEKSGEELPYSMTRRMPIIRIGETNREAQVIELAQELSPIAVDDFAAAYEEEYGVEQTSVKGDYIKYIADYIANGIISMEMESFTEEEQQRMAELFPGDFYKLSRFEAAYKHEFPEAGTSRLNALSMRSIGFKVYASCVMRDKWAKQSHFFDSLIFGSELFNENTVPSDVRLCHPYEIYVDNLIRERRLLPYEEGIWITENGLKELGITEESMMGFTTSAASFCMSQGINYCTTTSLVNGGFNHELFSYELSEEFYATLLCTEDTRFTALSCSHKKIACLDEARVTVAAFLESQVEEDESLTVEDLIARIETDFGIRVKRDKVLSAPSRTDLYYSSITDMIYKNRQTFIKEVE